MNSRTLTTVLAVAVVLLSAVVGWLLWKRDRPDGETPSVSTPVKNPLAERSLASSEKLDEERRRLAADFEKKVAEYFASQQAREEALRQELAKAREEDRQRLEQQIAQLRQETEGYSSSLGAWRERVESLPDPPPEPSLEAVPPPDFEAPPIPPAPSEVGEGGGDESFKAFLDIAAAAVCLAEPPLCDVAMLVAQILGGLGSIAGGKEVFETIGQIQQGLPVSEDDLAELSRTAQDNPQLKDPLHEILGTLLDENSDTPGAGDLAEVVMDLAPQVYRGVPEDIAREIQRNAPCEALKSHLERSGDEVRFASEKQKTAIRRAIVALGRPETDRFWEGCLASLEVE